MDYEKLSEKALDEIMANLRKELEIETHSTDSNYSNNENTVINTDFANEIESIDRLISQQALGTQIGLHKAPMQKKKGLLRFFSRFIEKLYLRIAELNNRDIRAFNQNVVDAIITLSYIHKSTMTNYEKNITDLQNQMQNDFIKIRNETASLRNDTASLRNDTASLRNDTASLRNDVENLQNNVSELEDNRSQLVEKDNKIELLIRDLYERLAGINAVVQWHNSTKYKSEPNAKEAHHIDNSDFSLFYRDFEEKFRGTREDIKGRQRVYIPFLQKHFENWEEKKYIDIGCGRGEWLELLRESDIRDTIGIDINSVQIAFCKELDLNVLERDCLEYLRELSSESVDVISGFQIIEHFDLDMLLSVLAECYRVLRKNGVVIFETPNPSNLITAATWFYVDPTHSRPIYKDFAHFLVERSGFNDVEIMEVNPPIYSQTLMTPTCLDGNQPVWDLNIEVLNNLLYSPQDYAVIGVKR